MRAALVGLVGFLGCERGDAHHYVSALGEKSSYEDALAHCARVDHMSARGDCQTAVLEMWDRLEESDCALVEDPLWRDECVFLLAERRYAAGELASAIQTCHRTRFGRKCSWHLLQDLAQATLDRPPTEVESMLTPFLEADPMPDFKDQFWRIRFREQGAAGRTLDESACVGLVDEMSCESAVHYHVRSILDALAKTGLERTCERPMGQRATVADGAAWSLGAITEDAENQWVQQRCEVRRPPHP